MKTVAKTSKLIGVKQNPRGYPNRNAYAKCKQLIEDAENDWGEPDIVYRNPATIYSFAVSAVNSKGKRVKGIMYAETSKEILDKMRDTGHIYVTIQDKKIWKKGSSKNPAKFLLIDGNGKIVATGNDYDKLQERADRSNEKRSLTQVLTLANRYQVISQGDYAGLKGVSKNPSQGGFPQTIKNIRDRIKRSSSGIAFSSLNDWQQSYLIPAYSHIFVREGGRVKLTELGKSKRITDWLNEELKTKNPNSYTLAQLADYAKGWKNLSLVQFIHTLQALPPHPLKRIDRETAKKVYNFLHKKKNSGSDTFTNHESNTIRKHTKMFQGEVRGGRARVLQPNGAPKEKSLLGQLVLMRVVKNGKTIDIGFDGDALLTMDLRKNLWAVGKDARINNLEKPAKGQMKLLGKLIQIDYITAKKHIENGELTRFWHPLGEVNKQYPNLYMDADGFPIIHGGGYDVWNVGIVN